MGRERGRFEITRVDQQTWAWCYFADPWTSVATAGEMEFGSEREAKIAAQEWQMGVRDARWRTHRSVPDALEDDAWDDDD